MAKVEIKVLLHIQVNIVQYLAIYINLDIYCTGQWYPTEAVVAGHVGTKEAPKITYSTYIHSMRLLSAIH